MALRPWAVAAAAGGSQEAGRGEAPPWAVAAAGASPVEAAAARRAGPSAAAAAGGHRAVAAVDTLAAPPRLRQEGQCHCLDGAVEVDNTADIIDGAAAGGPTWWRRRWSR